jgi:acetyl esterase/lipase
MSCWNNRCIQFLLLIAVNFGVIAQVPKDTSYTALTTLIKQKKHYQGVAIPLVEPSKRIRVIADTTFLQLGERQLLADLYFPATIDEKHPGILMIHGGGWRAGDKFLMKSMAIKFAEKGYTVMVPEYRLSLEIGYPAAIYDLKAALRWFRINANQFGLDDTRIAILGCSAGGQLAALVGVTGGTDVYYEDPKINISNKVQAIVDIDGVLKFKHPDSREGKVAADWLGGDYEEVFENWEQASALNHANENTPPTLFLASKYPRFLAGHMEYMEILEQNSIIVRKVEMGDAPHSFWLLEPWFDSTINHVSMFLNEVLND